MSCLWGGEPYPRGYARRGLHSLPGLDEPSQPSQLPPVLPTWRETVTSHACRWNCSGKKRHKFGGAAGQQSVSCARRFETKYFNRNDFALSIFDFIINEGMHEGISADRTTSDPKAILLKIKQVEILHAPQQKEVALQPVTTNQLFPN